MNKLPHKISDEEELDELISRPSSELIETFSHIKEDILILGVSGKIGHEILSVRDEAKEFGKLFGVKPKLVNKEAKTALLSNSSIAFDLFGYPKVPVNQIIKWISEWIKEDRMLRDLTVQYIIGNQFHLFIF
jgi:hypothetical protein